MIFVRAYSALPSDESPSRKCELLRMRTQYNTLDTVLSTKRFGSSRWLVVFSDSCLGMCEFRCSDFYGGIASKDNLKDEDLVEFVQQN